MGRAILATSNVESLALGVVGSLVASLVFLAFLRWRARSKFEATAAPTDAGFHVLLMNKTRRAMFDIELRAHAVSRMEDMHHVVYSTTRSLGAETVTIPYLEGHRPRDYTSDPTPGTTRVFVTGTLTEHERLWLVVTAVDSTTGVRTAMSVFPMGPPPVL